MLVYIAGSYTAETTEQRDEFVEIAVETAKQVAELGHIPIVSHKITHGWEEDDRFSHWTGDDWLERICYPMIERCDALLVSCGLETSYGVGKEIEFANDLGIPVFLSIEEFKEYLNDRF